jgi:spore coat protein U-like protein
MASTFRLSTAVASAILAGSALVGTARAADGTATLDVQATVQSNCTISGATLNFGAYNKANRTDAQTNIGYSCQGPSNLRIDLSAGQSGDTGSRRMSAAGISETLEYFLYQDSARNIGWANIPGSASLGPLLLTGVTTGSATVYGRIFENQTVPPGTYTDQVIITLTIQ